MSSNIFLTRNFVGDIMSRDIMTGYSWEDVFNPATFFLGISICRDSDLLRFRTRWDYNLSGFRTCWDFDMQRL